MTLPLFLSLALYSLAPFAHWISLSNLIENTNVTDTVSSLHSSGDKALLMIYV